MVNKYNEGIIPEYNKCVTEFDKVLQDFTLEKIEAYTNNMEKYMLSNALIELWQIITRTNKYIDETSPWALAKDEEKKTELDSVMYHLTENLRKVAIMIYPFMKDTANNMFEQLGITEENLKAIESLNLYTNGISNVKVIEKGIPLFQRLDMEEEVNYIKGKMSESIK